MIDGVEIFEQLSGAAGDVIAARNASGPYFRPRSAVTVPMTSHQAQMQDAYSALAAEWKTNLTQAERDRWDAYALTVPKTDPLGYSLGWSGFNAFVSLHAIRWAFGFTTTLPAPPAYRRVEVPTIGIAQDPRFPNVNITFDEDADWTTTEGAKLFIFASAPLPPSRLFWVGPYRHLHTLSGDEVSPPNSPRQIELDQLPTEDAIVHFRAVFSDADGAQAQTRFSTLIYTPPVLVAAATPSFGRITLDFDKPLVLMEGEASGEFTVLKCRGITDAVTINILSIEQPFIRVHSSNPYQIRIDRNGAAANTTPPRHATMDPNQTTFISQQGVYPSAVNVDLPWP